MALTPEQRLEILEATNHKMGGEIMLEYEKKDTSFLPRIYTPKDKQNIKIVNRQRDYNEIWIDGKLCAHNINPNDADRSVYLPDEWKQICENPATWLDILDATAMVEFADLSDRYDGSGGISDDCLRTQYARNRLYIAGKLAGDNLNVRRLKHYLNRENILTPQEALPLLRIIEAQEVKKDIPFYKVKFNDLNIKMTYHRTKLVTDDYLTTVIINGKLYASGMIPNKNKFGFGYVSPVWLGAVMNDKWMRQQKQKKK